MKIKKDKIKMIQKFVLTLHSQVSSQTNGKSFFSNSSSVPECHGQACVRLTFGHRGLIWHKLLASCTARLTLFISMCSSARWHRRRPVDGAAHKHPSENCRSSDCTSRPAGTWNVTWGTVTWTAPKKKKKKAGPISRANDKRFLAFIGQATLY